jgi:hypothetical protein
LKARLNHDTDGWLITKHAVCLLSDTAVTTNAEVDLEPSMFGEMPLVHDEFRTFEGGAKILPFERCLVDLVGRVDAASSFLSWIAPSLQHRDLPCLVAEAARYHRTSLGPTFEFLIAHRFADQPELWRFYSNKEHLLKIEKRCVLGSAGQESRIQQLIVQKIKSAIALALLEEDQLALCCAQLQFLGHETSLFELALAEPSTGPMLMLRESIGRRMRRIHSVRGSSSKDSSPIQAPMIRRPMQNPWAFASSAWLSEME